MHSGISPFDLLNSRRRADLGYRVCVPVLKSQFVNLKFLVLVLALLAALPGSAFAQAVGVVARLDTNSIHVGGSTVLHIQAQVLSSVRTNADRIFSWYIDVLDTNGVAATAQWGSMTKPASDNDPQTSSSGVNDGANRRAIYDTFLNLPGAGVSNLVELITVPISGLAPGRTRFRVQAGTGAGLSQDFMVAPKSGGNPYTGGDYTAAFADLTVVGDCTAPQISVTPLDGSGLTARWTLRFTPCSGFNHFVESVDQLQTNAVWQALPGAPHNSGSVIISNSVPKRFYRVRVN